MGKGGQSVGPKGWKLCKRTCPLCLRSFPAVVPICGCTMGGRGLRVDLGLLLDNLAESGGVGK